MRQRIRPTRPTTKRIPWPSKAQPTAGTDAQARGEQVPAPLPEARRATRMSWLHPIRSSPRRSSMRSSTRGNSTQQRDGRGRVPAEPVEHETRAGFFGRGSHSCFQNRIARQATEREDGHIVTWDNVNGAPRAPYLNEPMILPSGRRNILNACVERQDGGSRSAVLKSCERGLGESPLR